MLLGLRGGLVEATSQVELATGQSYEFTVAATAPRIILSTARPLLLPGLTAAAASGRGEIPVDAYRAVAEILAFLYEKNSSSP